MEEYAYVIDYLPYGKGDVKKPMAQVIGEKGFTLLEVILKEDAFITVGERVFVGKDNRDKVEKILRRLSYEDLTAIAKENLLPVLEEMIRKSEQRFIMFINLSRPFSIRVHPLELIPGVGKKNAQLLIEEREKQPFQSFEDVKKRVPTWANPVRSMAERILRELKKEEKYYFFVKPPIPAYRRRR